MKYKSPQINLTSSSAHIEEYLFDPTLGEGYIKRVRTAPGIDVVFTNIKGCIGQNIVASSEFRGCEIFYCLEGLIEIELENGRRVKIGENQMYVLDSKCQTKHFHYLKDELVGISIFFMENEKVNESLEKYLGESYVNISSFIKSVCQDDIYVVGVPNKFSMDIFVDMERCPLEQQAEYLKLKALELYLICSRKIGLIDNKKMKQTNREVNNKLKLVVLVMKDNIEELFTLNQLADTIGINPDRLKKMFKSIYKENISVYYRKLRLNHGRLLLLNSDYSVTEVASMAGYNNPSKFSSAFKKEFSYTPLSYRKSFIS